MWDAIVAIFSGGLTGLVGNALNGVLGYFQQKQEFKQEIELRRLDIEMLDKELASADHRAEILAEGKIAEADAQSRAVAYKMDRRTFSEGLVESLGTGWSKSLLTFLLVTVDLVRGYTRPTMTWYAAAATTAMVWWIFKYTEGLLVLDAQKLEDIIWYIVLFVFYLLGMVLSFWFCERNRIKPPQLPK